MVVPTGPEPRKTGPVGTVTLSVPVDETVNVAMVPSLGPGPEVVVDAAAGRADAKMSAPHAATLPAVSTNSGLCMVFPP